MKGRNYGENEGVKEGRKQWGGMYRMREEVGHGDIKEGGSGRRGGVGGGKKEGKVGWWRHVWVHRH